METVKKVMKDVLRHSDVLSQPVLADSLQKDKEKEKNIKSKEVWHIHCTAKSLWTPDNVGRTIISEAYYYSSGICKFATGC